MFTKVWLQQAGKLVEVRGIWLRYLQEGRIAKKKYVSSCFRRWHRVYSTAFLLPYQENNGPPLEYLRYKR
jgi:hypothetical protein